MIRRPVPTGNRECRGSLEVAAGDFEKVGGGEAEGAEETSGVAGKVKRKMAGAGRDDAGEGEVLEENSEFIEVCVIVLGLGIGD